MTKKQQEIVREVLPDGTIEVTVTPIFTNVRSCYVDQDGIKHVGIITEEELRGICNIPDEYNTVAFKPNNWPQQQRISKHRTEPFIGHQAKGTFSPPKADQVAAERILAELRKASPKVAKIKHTIKKRRGKRMLEIAVMDPHFGLACFEPSADLNYDLKTARYLYLEAIRELVHLALAHGNIDEIVFVFGNDYIHAEPQPGRKGSAFGTTSGVNQSEMLNWTHTYVFAEETVITAIEMLTEVAPVRVVVVPGNHDGTSSFTLGRVLFNRFYNNKNVTVEADASPYKFVRWGVNLIGFEHGHNIPPIRLAALMANECSGDGPRKGWFDETKYHEWHLGDQHRKGSAKPAMFEEQGVSIEYLPSIVAPNEWHRLKAFNHQKRGAMAFLWDASSGPIARIGVNLLGKEEDR